MDTVKTLESMTPEEKWNFVMKSARSVTSLRPLQPYRVLDRQTGRRGKAIDGARAARAVRDAKNATHHAGTRHKGYDGRLHAGLPKNPNLWRYCLSSAA